MKFILLMALLVAPAAAHPKSAAWLSRATTTKEVKKVRQNRQFICPRGSEGCFACSPYEKILKGEAEYVGVGGYGQDMYLIS